MAQDRKNAPATAKRSGSSRSGAAATGTRNGKGGRTRPAANVVAPQRPWGLIAAAIAVVVFAAAVITYAVIKVNEANANRIESVDEIEGIRSYDYAAGQEHVVTTVEYSESPPVGGPHAPPPDWADCTGTVYDVDIRHENAVHSLEHGAVWVTYNPDEVTDEDIATLAELVENEPGRMLSPYVGQDSPVSIQSWGHQLKVDDATDERLKQFADFLTLNSEFTPEPGASCENPTFAANPTPAEVAPQ
ncbi:DUF3105 domain-containing protein [Blastococcus sp. PRF04-17]|uniref:DUF3105 domain-containing protein n=1 Tax=Blastococcus sp. PRF04-17 TaxID=2933797 RepID=UPI001FF68F59|nr:DUF3105 domain-containing protein [Blastococcus sp. PRF04-17]UOY01383.1 DUF3105 domain-containing protein [Blastococcus sp. PRF04-17]